MAECFDVAEICLQIIEVFGDHCLRFGLLIVTHVRVVVRVEFRFDVIQAHEHAYLDGAGFVIFVPNTQSQFRFELVSG